MHNLSFKSYTATLLIMLIAGYSLFAGLVPLARASSTDNDLVSCWSFDGDGNDSVGVNNLTNNNFMPYVAGKFADAADIDGLNNPTDGKYLSITDAVQTGLDFTNAMSISLWVNFDATVGGDPLVTKFDPGGNQSYGLVMDTPDDLISFYADANGDGLSENDPNSSPLAIWSFNPSLHQWYHLLMTYSAGEAHFYVDGVEVPLVSNKTDSTLYNSNAPFRVGHTPAVSQESDLKMDELGVWSRALTTKEIKKVYKKGRGMSCSSMN